jgi:DNA-binding response OmpR family regulator
MDVGLPDGDGFDACEQIKSARPELPVVLISSVYRTTESRREGFRAGADAYLIEPVDPAVLVRTISQMVGDYPRAPAASPATVRTSPDARIVRANAAAARLLNVGERGAVGRSVLTFFER